MLDSLKGKVVEIAIKAEHYGLCKEKTGNFSFRDKDTGYILITPSGVGFGWKCNRSWERY